MRNSKRFLGLELSGAKNQKTALAVLEYYPKEGKAFLLDIHDRIHTEAVAEANRHGEKHRHGEKTSGLTSDEALLQVIHELSADVARMGVNVPLQLPPCFNCTKKKCRPGGKCNAPAVKWMREITAKAERSHHVKALDFTPYTQRPIELWVRYQVLPKLHPHERFEIDETLGGNKAPLTARMRFLKRHLGALKLSEVWPKLSVAALASELQLSKRTISAYRRLEEGVHAREDILESLTRHHDIFIYERDIRKLALNLASFDAFICAYTALLVELSKAASPPAGFPLATGWVAYPALSHR